MAIEIKVPDIGTDEVEITEILVKVGDKVEAEHYNITHQTLKTKNKVKTTQEAVEKKIKVSVGDKPEAGGR
ncbi:biotin/lipoyl-containing protein, partial [Salmonella enterica]|uniref:biotin/lipoyl-containing protein n=1 Tax=Salmonella enterica TaxID=28901 RepID=UPI0009C84551